MPISRAACRAEPIELAVRRLLRDTVEDLRASEATLWVFSEAGDRLEAALNDGPTREIVEAQSVAVDGSVVGMVASVGMAECIGPGDAHDDTVDEATGTDTSAMAAAPVVLGRGGDVFGVLSAINPTDRASFDGEALEKIAWQAYLIGLVVCDGLSEKGEARR